MFGEWTQVYKSGNRICDAGSDRGRETPRAVVGADLGGDICYSSLICFRALPPARVLSSVEASVGSITASLGALKVGARQKEDIPPVDKTMRRERATLKGVLGSGLLLDDPRWVPCLQQAISVLTELKNAVCDWRHRFAAACELLTSASVANLSTYLEHSFNFPLFNFVFIAVFITIFINGFHY